MKNNQAANALIHVVPHNKRHRCIQAILARTFWSMACVLCMLVTAACPAFSSPTTGTSFVQSISKTTDTKAVIRVGAYDNYPKIFKNKQGIYAGIFPDLLNNIAQKEQWTLEYVPGTWSQCLERLKKHEIDIMVDVAYSEKRSKLYDFNKEPALNNWGIVYTKEDFQAPSLMALKDKTIAVMRNSIHTSGEDGIINILRRFNIPCSYIEVESYQEVFSLLSAGTVDAGVVNRIFGSVFEKDYNVRKTSIIFNPREIAFAFPKNATRSSMLSKTIDNHLLALKKNHNSFLYTTVDKYLSGRTLAQLPTQNLHNGQLVPLTPEEREWIKSHPQIRLGVDPEFSPFEFITNSQKYSGIASDYVQLLNERTGLRMEVVHGLEWPQVINKIRLRELDVLPCVGKTPERKQYLYFSRPYVQYQRIIITRSNAPFITGIQDLHDARIAVQKSSAHEDFLQDYKDIEILTFETLKDSLLAVSNGNADAFVGNLASATYWIRKQNLTNLKIAAPATHSTESLHFAIRHDWPILVRIINKGLASITHEEEQAIMQKWVDIHYKPNIFQSKLWKYVLQGAVLAAIAFLVVLAWSYKLKKEVTRRKKITQQLRYKNELEHIISEMSSRFIVLSSDEVDTSINIALKQLVEFTGADGGHLYSYDAHGNLSCTHFWEHTAGESASACLSFDNDTLSWWKKSIQSGKNVVFTTPDDLPATAQAEKEHFSTQGIISLLDVPRSYGYEVVGLIGLSTNKKEKVWTEGEIKLLDMAGQIATNALMRQHTEDSLQRYATKLKTANAQLKELDRLKSMFIASMSHELRTPLNSIIGFTGVILQGMAGELNSKQQDQLGRVYQSAKHLLELITDVIDISKIEAGRVDVITQEFKLMEVVDESITAIQTLLKGKDITLEIDVSPDILMNTDRKRVLQCVINFLSNAVKYSENGTVSLKASTQNGMVQVLISDMGIGIPEPEIPKLFHAFERLNSQLRVKAGGTGLGLYLTKKLACELLKGSVSVESTLGQGSTFGFLIPQDLQKATMHEQKSQEQKS